MIFILHFIVVMSSSTLINGGYILKKEFGDLLGIATFTQLIADYMQYLDINYNHFWLDISNFKILVFSSLIYTLFITIIFLMLGLLLLILGTLLNRNVNTKNINRYDKNK